MLLLLLFLILFCWSLYILLLLLFFVSLVCPWRVCTFSGPMECWEESCNKASFSSFAFSCCRTTSTKHGANGHWTNDTTWRSKNDLAFGIGCDKHDILIHPVSWYSKNLLPKPWFLAAKVPCQWHVLVLSTAGGLCKIPRPWSSHHLPLKWILGPWCSQIWKKSGRKWEKKNKQNGAKPSHAKFPSSSISKRGPMSRILTSIDCRKLLTLCNSIAARNSCGDNMPSQFSSLADKGLQLSRGHA